MCGPGDQEDVSVLSEIVEDAKQFSGYDIIVDDGGHKAIQMLASFKVGLPSLRECPMLVKATCSM